MEKIRPSLVSIGFLSLGLTCTGCSFLFTKQPPSNLDNVPVTHASKCTSSVAAPVIDSIIGGYQVVRSVVAVSADDSTYQGAPITREMDIGFGVTLAALFISSAAYGFVVTSNCREWKTQHGSMAYAPRDDAPLADEPNEPAATPPLTRDEGLDAEPASSP